MKTGIIWLCLLGVALQAMAATNFIHNSSFEVGASGWTTYGSFSGDTFGNEAAVADHVVSTNATHGSKSMWYRTRLIARPMYLMSGPYTLTFDAVAESAFTLRAGVQRTYLITSTPSDTFSVTTSRQRFTNTFTVATNGWYVAKFMTLVAGTVPLTWIDSVQLEQGSTATAYAPGPIIEVGMNTADAGNHLFLADAKTLRFNLWNAGPQTNVTVYYEILHGVWNTNITTGTISTNALAALTNTTINLALPSLWGDMRITCYVTNVHDTWDETSVSVFPYPPGSGRDTNGLLGIHTHYSPYHLAHARRIGFTRTRFFSPMTDARWINVFPTFNTTNIFPVGTGHWLLDYAFEYAVTNDLVPFVTLAGNLDWYSRTNADLMLMVADWTNYVGRLVNRYKDPAFNVHEWEIWNEPQQGGDTVIDFTNPDNYAAIYTNAARLIKTNDPNATVIAFAGLSSASQLTAYWNALSPQGQLDTDVVAVHNYPQEFGGRDPNNPDDDNTFSVVNIGNIARAFGGIRPIWNDETAVSDAGGYHTINVAYAFPYYWGTDAIIQADPWASEAHFNEMNVRKLPSMDRQTYNFCRSAGWGYTHYNIQYGRFFADEAFLGNYPSIYEPNGTIKPSTVALLMANHFVKHPGRGRLTNAANYWVEAYLHTNIFGVVVPIWDCSKGNQTLQFTNPFVALYDTFGNLIQTNSTNIAITRSVRYLVSGTLTAVQISNCVWSALVVTNQDTKAPGLTVDLSPIGNTVAWGGVTNAFKATAIDETITVATNGAAFPHAPTGVETNIMYRWSFNAGSTWSPWGVTNHFYHSFASPGNYAVSWQAKDLANNMTPMVTGPSFGDMSLVPSAPANLNVSGTARIGTVTIAP